MSEYPNQPRARGGWPEQPPIYSQSGGSSRGDYDGSYDGEYGSYDGEYGGSYDGEYRGSYDEHRGSYDDEYHGEYGQARGGSYGEAYRGAPGGRYRGDYGGQYRQGYGGRPSPFPMRGPVRRRRRRGRGWIALGISLAVLAVLFFVGDQVAKGYAQNVIAQKIESSGLNTKPSVHIEGWPFLTQIATHDVRAIDISASNVPAGKFTISSIQARATGVHLNSSFNSATIDHIDGTATISYKSLESALSNAVGIPGLSIGTITPDPKDGPNAVNVNAGIASVTAKVVQTAPQQITLEFGTLNSSLGSLLGGSATIPNQVISIPALPAGLVVRSVAVNAQGVVATATATNTTLSQ